MFGFGRGFGRGFGWWGRGFGWGARLGYCPWTGMPRGWRWMGYYPYSWTPPVTYGANVPVYGTEDIGVLKAQADALREEIRRIEERIRQLEEQGR